jgi:multidrug efflux pump subunit AcrA (membrane-fusion protein)
MSTSITPELIQRQIQQDSSLKFIRRMILARRFVVLTVPINSYPLTILAMAQAKQGQAQAQQAKQQAKAQAQQAKAQARQAKAQAQQAKQTNKLKMEFSSRLTSIEEGIERILGGRDVHKRASVHRSWICSVCNQDGDDFSRNQLKKGIMRKCRGCVSAVDE